MTALPQRDGEAMMDEARARRVVEWYDGEDSAFHAELVSAIIEAFKSVRAEATLAERERIRAECAKQALLGAAQWDRVFPENQMKVESAWQPIDTAPKDGTEILVLLNMATVWVAHIAWWRKLEDMSDEDPELVGWWSYVRHSVTQEMLTDYHAPLYWMPFEEPEGYLWGIELGPHHPSIANREPPNES